MTSVSEFMSEFAKFGWARLKVYNDFQEQLAHAASLPGDFEHLSDADAEDRAVSLTDLYEGLAGNDKFFSAAPHAVELLF